MNTRPIKRNNDNVGALNKLLNKFSNILKKLLANELNILDILPNPSTKNPKEIENALITITNNNKNTINLNITILYPQTNE